MRIGGTGGLKDVFAFHSFTVNLHIFFSSQHIFHPVEYAEICCKVLKSLMVKVIDSCISHYQSRAGNLENYAGIEFSGIMFWSVSHTKLLYDLQDLKSSV